MKKNIFQTLLVLAFLFITGITSNTASACPSAYSQTTTPPVYEGSWFETGELWFQYYDPVTGCHCTVIYTACYRVNVISQLHEVSLSSIKLYFLNCPPDILFTPRLIDSILVNVFSQEKILAFIGLNEVPFCPNTVCLLRVYDRICYNGWQPTSDGSGTTMRVCKDDSPDGAPYPRSCSEVVYACIDPITFLPQITRSGSPTGPACPQGCSSECDKK